MATVMMMIMTVTMTIMMMMTMLSGKFRDNHMILMLTAFVI